VAGIRLELSAWHRRVQLLIFSGLLLGAILIAVTVSVEITGNHYRNQLAQLSQRPAEQGYVTPAPDLQSVPLPVANGSEPGLAGPSGQAAQAAYSGYGPIRPPLPPSLQPQARQVQPVQSAQPAVSPAALPMASVAPAAPTYAPVAAVGPHTTTSAPANATRTAQRETAQRERPAPPAYPVVPTRPAMRPEIRSASPINPVNANAAYSAAPRDDSVREVVVQDTAPPAPTPPQSQPVSQPQRPTSMTGMTGAPQVEAVTQAQARVHALSAAGVTMNDGTTIPIGGRFPSGEHLVRVDPAMHQIVTDQRTIVLMP
jgi:hypothetical protein